MRSRRAPTGLVDLPPAPAAAPPRDVCRFLREADRRIERFRRDHHLPGFVPSDFAACYAALAALEEEAPGPGRSFCE